jgi:Fungal Zn(2)-Cys(6) binuclear cluster domain/Fungal specific transcription factor domain
MAESQISKTVFRGTVKSKSKTGCITCRYVRVHNISVLRRFGSSTTPQPRGSSHERSVTLDQVFFYSFLEAIYLLILLLGRIRHVKCDERKPQCQRCLKYGQECAGYATPSTTTLSTTITRNRRFHPQLLPKSKGFTFSYPSSILPNETSIENKYFCHFRNCTAPELAGPFDGYLWEALILQAFQQKTFVRHAVLAIGALDMSLRVVTDEVNSPGRGLASMHREFALLKYSKALKEMKSTLSGMDSSPRDTLIACLLVVCLENLLGNRHLALLHAQVGFRLLQNWLSKHPYSLPYHSGISSPASHTIEDDLVLVFGKLDLQISCVSDTRPFQEHVALKDINTATVEHMPTIFTDLKQAKLFWDIIMRRTCHFMFTAFSMSNSPELSRDFEAIPPSDISVPTGTNIHSSTNVVSHDLCTGQAIYSQELSRWSKAFEPLFLGISRSLDKSSRVAAVLLQIHYVATQIMLSALTFTDETSYDQCEPKFRQIIDLIQSGAYLRRKSSSIWDRGISFDLGLTSPLCLIVMRCRHPSIRREAIAILRSLPIEGAWEPEIIAALGNWIMEVEEEGMSAGVIPETSRAIFSRISTSEDPRKRLALFQCVQRKGSPSGGPQWIEAFVHW